MHCLRLHAVATHKVDPRVRQQQAHAEQRRVGHQGVKVDLHKQHHPSEHHHGSEHNVEGGNDFRALKHPHGLVQKVDLQQARHGDDYEEDVGEPGDVGLRKHGGVAVVGFDEGRGDDLRAGHIEGSQEATDSAVHVDVFRGVALGDGPRVVEGVRQVEGQSHQHPEEDQCAPRDHAVIDVALRGLGGPGGINHHEDPAGHGRGSANEAGPRGMF